MSLRLVQTRPTAPPPAAAEVSPAVLRAAAAGENTASRLLVTTYERRVFTFALRLLGTPQAAEDAAQETFLRAFAALARFDPAGPARLSTWLLTIAHRVCLDELRRRRRRTAEPLDDVDELAAPDAALGLDERVSHKASAGHVERALLALPFEQRAVFALRVLLELTVEETALALDIDEGTVKSRLSRARTALRTTLGEALHG